MPVTNKPYPYSLLIYQDENKDEDENQSFRSFLYVLKQTCDEQTNVILMTWFACHRYYLGQTETFVFGFVFVWVSAHEQAIAMCLDKPYRHVVIISLVICIQMEV